MHLQRPRKKRRTLEPSSGALSKRNHDFVKIKTTPRISIRGSLTGDLPRRHEEDPEDARIAWLEAKLGIDRSRNGKHKMKSPSFGDGLDDILNVELSDESEASEYSDFRGFLTSEEDAKEQFRSAVESDAKSPRENEESSPIDRSQEIATVVRSADPHGPRPENRHTLHLFPRSEIQSSEALARLSRQLKGLLNRLSEQNIASILSAVEELYRTQRRNDMTSALTNLIINNISSHTSLLDSFITLHASLIASLHKIIGIELVAHFVQCLVIFYEDNYRAMKTSDTSNAADHESHGGKKCLNLVVLLSELYNFQVISCGLVYDVIRSLLENLDEFDVELLLKIARNSGQQLRQDDPSALRDIIHIVQTKMGSKELSMISSRTRFMIETLTNLKNNKVKRSLGQDGNSEKMERMKKFLSGLNKKYHILAHGPLRITLEDLHSSEEKGKWWLVGSAWSADPLLDRKQSIDQRIAAKDSDRQAADALNQLARKQGMNTDVRRSIFVVLMSSHDYIDACDRLSQLNLTEVQQREIVRVILLCLGNEKLYNPFYSLIIQQLCRTSHSYKVTLQFCLWDFLRSLGEKSVGGAEIIKNLQDDGPHIEFDVKVTSSTKLLNLARAYAWWFARGCLSLAVLKPVDFTILRPQSLKFFRVLFPQLFISTQVTSPAIGANDEAAQHLPGSRNRDILEAIFVKATRVPSLPKGLSYFLTTLLLDEVESSMEVVSEMLRWAREVAKDTLRTGMDVIAS